MGETLGISHNVFEKVEREKDRKERMKKYEEWQKTKVKKQQKIAEMKAKAKEASNGSLANVAVSEVCILTHAKMYRGPEAIRRHQIFLGEGGPRTKMKKSSENFWHTTGRRTLGRPPHKVKLLF